MKWRLSLSVHPHLHILGSRSFSRTRVLLRLARLAFDSHIYPRSENVGVDCWWYKLSTPVSWAYPVSRWMRNSHFYAHSKSASPALSSSEPARAQAKLQCTNKLEAQRKLRMSCDLMTTELFSHACDTWVIVMRVIVMVITVTRFSFPNKSQKLLIILSRLVSAWSLQSVLGAENEGDNPIEWLKNSIPGKHASDWSPGHMKPLIGWHTEWD